MDMAKKIGNRDARICVIGLGTDNCDIFIIASMKVNKEFRKAVGFVSIGPVAEAI
ncbi:MAG: hypothetical protein PHU53_01205 [Thermoplasmata archaeon]|nr:hypothetical protein [Thermoplasmata archaeon]